MKNEFRSVASAGSPVQAAVRVSTIDKNGNETQFSEYDWIPYGSITRDGYGAPSGFSGGTAARTTAKTYSVTTPNAGDGSENIADETNGYWNPGSANVRNLLTRSVITGTGPDAGPGAVSEFSYGDASGHPNLIQERHWDSTKAQISRLRWTAPIP